MTEAGAPSNELVEEVAILAEWARSSKDDLVARTKAGDNDDLCPMIEFRRDGEVIGMVICPDVDRDQALQACHMAVPGWSADYLVMLLDAHMADRAFQEKFGRMPDPGELQRLCDVEGACDLGLTTDCIVVLEAWRSGRQRMTQLPYHAHHTREITASLDLLPERLSSKIMVRANGCWEWTAATDDGGYGVVGRGTREEGQLKAHNLVFEAITNGPCPAGLEPDHICENTSCVNPHHLDWVTHAENSRRGKKAKLTNEDVEKIRQLAADGVAYATIAEQFGTSPAYVGHVVKERRWKQPKTPAPKHVPVTRRGVVHWIEDDRMLSIDTDNSGPDMSVGGRVHDAIQAAFAIPCTRDEMKGAIDPADFGLDPEGPEAQIHMDLAIVRLLGMAGFATAFNARTDLHQQLLEGFLENTATFSIMEPDGNVRKSTGEPSILDVAGIALQEKLKEERAMSRAEDLAEAERRRAEREQAGKA
jgi:hypothetical protein